jgi:hypothetical protein
MKEYKFRSWDKLSMEYFDFEDMFYETANKITGSDYSDAKIMQYINIKDKNDKEIYEGDILGGWVYGTVEYLAKEARFAINICGELHEISFCEIEKHDLEIIGNIYENPKLLEGEKQNGTA